MEVRLSGQGWEAAATDAAELQGNAGEGAMEKVQGTQVAHGRLRHKPARLACFCTTSTVGVFSNPWCPAASGTQMHLLSQQAYLSHGSEPLSPDLGTAGEVRCWGKTQKGW